MAVGRYNIPQIVWGILLIAMGLLLVLKEPYALREQDSGFLVFARYFIAALLITAGGKKLHRFYFRKDEELPPEE